MSMLCLPQQTVQIILSFHGIFGQVGNIPNTSYECSPTLTKLVQFSFYPQLISQDRPEVSADSSARGRGGKPKEQDHKNETKQKATFA